MQLLASKQTPDFIGTEISPFSSPNLNPVGYEIWGLLQECVYSESIRDLKRPVIEHVADVKQSVVDKADEQWSGS